MTGVRQWYRRSLHLKLLVPTLLAGLVLALVCGFGLYALFKSHAKEEMASWAIRIADAVNYASESSPTTSELERFVTALGAEPDIEEIVVAAGDPLRVIAATRMAWWRHPLREVPDGRIRDQIRAALERGAHSRWRDGGRSLTAAVPLHIHRPKMDLARLSTGAVYVALDSRGELAAQKTHALFAGLALGGSILLLTIIGYAVLRNRVIQPVWAIHRTLEDRRAGNQQPYAPVASDDELGALARATNDLLDAQDERTSLYRQMFQNHPAVKLLISPEGSGTITDANHAAARFYGYAIEELRGMPLGRINTLPPDQLSRNLQRVRVEPDFRVQVQHALASGEVRDVEVHSGPIHVGGLEYLYSIIHDVTEENRSRRQLEIYHQVFRNLPVGVFRNTPGVDGRFLELNPAMVAIFDASSLEELARHPVADLYQDPAERELFSRQLLEKGSVQREEVRMRSLRGRPIWAAVTAYRHRDPDGTIYFDGTMEDITTRKEAEMARDRLIQILEATPDFVATSDLEGRPLYRNRGGWRMLGLSPNTPLEEAPRDDIHPDWALHRIQEAGIPTAIREGYWEGETALLDTAGREIPVSQVIVAHYGPDGEAERLSTIMRDISERKALESELQRQATHDRLTGLFNRHHFEALLSDEIQRAERYANPFSLVMFDIDHFKRVNDTHGHPVGDRVLCQVADTVQERLRQTDILARWGGEEFLALLPGTPLPGAAELAEYLRRAIADTETLPGIPATISLGVAEFRVGESWTTLLKRVDDALYRAKTGGRNRVETAREPDTTA
ncbi:diguanylate cyclase [Thiohalorhabdus methylotrophus]|uniref:diguanylate cyclase n=1 Tax=Thiohalorhabdus methylotrophus TaxID=3242694 RepID=A0ABV4TRX1_9GAMM